MKLLSMITEVTNSSKQTPSSDAKYEIKDIVEEYEIVIQPDLTSRISTEYQRWLCIMTESSDTDKLE